MDTSLATAAALLGLLFTLQPRETAGASMTADTRSGAAPMNAEYILEGSVRPCCLALPMANDVFALAPAMQDSGPSAPSNELFANGFEASL